MHEPVEPTLAGVPSAALLLIGAAMLLPVFIGLHNAWDTVTYVATAQRTPERATASDAGSEAAGSAASAAGG